MPVWAAAAWALTLQASSAAADRARLRELSAKSLQSCLTLCHLSDCTRWAPLSMGFPRQELWSGLPFPPPGHDSHPGIEPASLISTALPGRFLTTSATWEARTINVVLVCMLSRVRLFTTPRTVAVRLLCPWNFPGKDTGVQTEGKVCMIQSQSFNERERNAGGQQ